MTCKDCVHFELCDMESAVYNFNFPNACKVVFIGLNGSEEYGGGYINIVYSQRESYMWKFDFSDIGKTVFLTKSEAEKALREREE